jgi:ECF transporter S component (folate family)
MNQNLIKLILASLLSAIGVALFTFSFIIPLAGIPAIRIDFIAIPILVGGFILGKWYGLAIGAIIDIIGFLFFGQGVYFIGFTLNTALTGFVAGLIPQLIKKSSLKINISMMFTLIITALLAAIAYIVFTDQIRLGSENFTLDVETKNILITTMVTLGLASALFLHRLTQDFVINRRSLVVIVNAMLIAEIIVIVLTPIWILYLFDAPSFYIGVISRIVRASFLFPLKVIFVLAILTSFKKQHLIEIEVVS